MTLEIAFIRAGWRQNQLWRHRIDCDCGRKCKRRHPRKLGEHVFAQYVAGMSEVEPRQVRIVQVDDAATRAAAGEISAERQGHPGVDLDIRREGRWPRAARP